MSVMSVEYCVVVSVECDDCNVGRMMIVMSVWHILAIMKNNKIHVFKQYI